MNIVSVGGIVKRFHKENETKTSHLDGCAAVFVHERDGLSELAREQRF